MRSLLTKYKLVIRFIITFILVYGVLSFGYKFYLDFSNGSKYYPDYVTNLVGKQTEAVLNSFGYRTNIVPHYDEPSLMVFVEQKYIARVIEGCNGMSVIILFIAFVVAFSDTFKRTFLFILAGSVLIYAVNLIRIVLLTVGLHHYPWRSEIMHEVIFPLAIYGMVFMLWMFWVNQFSKKVKPSNV
ncbi:exosortase family protein XrtF [Winogradskyella wandonensis]|uniref:Exosortase family protein XrtF n=1 Tax=Winogradskyella wandonensis TaxID=1442586 RepID=A0A4R1KRT3_9FLAO|nr:exosortase family protein XrtF [Winogradskyella wandonensis]TCK67283.1 exosortase family protein XrtF [Winogradskyella wandonensis]